MLTVQTVPACRPYAACGRMRLMLLGFCMLALFSFNAAQAGNSLVIRLVLAHNDSSNVSPGLSDVQRTLSKNIPFKGFELLDQKRLPLPGGGKITMRHNIRLTASGSQGSLKVAVRHKRSRFVNTTLRLSDGRPVILGGIPSRRGKLLVVIVAR